MPRSIIIRITCDTCAVSGRETVLPEGSKPMPVAIGQASADLDMCDDCKTDATLGQVIEAMRRLGAQQPEPKRWDGHKTPCPLCDHQLSSSTGIWSHLHSQHGIRLSAEQKAEIWDGGVCPLGCGQALNGLSSLHVHIGRAAVHKDLPRKDLFGIIAQIRADGDHAGVAAQIIKRMQTFSDDNKRGKRAS